MDTKMINRFYHAELRQKEEQEHWQRFESGRDLQLGKVYKGFRFRNGATMNDSLIPLSFEDGILMLSINHDLQNFCFVSDDVVDLGNMIYTEGRPVFIHLKRTLPDLMKESCDNRVEQLQRSASYKMWRPLSSYGAERILKWWTDR